MDCVEFLLVFCLVCFSPVQCVIDLTSSTTDLCINEQVEYQCTVTGSSVNILLWRVLDNNGTQIGGVAQYTSLAVTGGTTPVGGVFTAEQLSDSPLTSTLSFTVQSSINGYTVRCEDGNTIGNETLIIAVNADPVAVLGYTDFTESSVNISWTDLSSSPCVTGYRYNISSLTSGWEDVSISTSSPMSTSAIVNDLVVSSDPYHVTVTVYEKYTSSRDSEESCFYFNVPQNVQNLDASNETGSEENMVNVVVMWDTPEDILNDCNFSPMLTGYEVSITPSISVNNLPGPVTLPPSATMHTFNDVPEGVNYTITVIARNGVGINSTDTFIEVSGTFVPITTTSSSSSSSSSSMSLVSVSMTSSTPARSSTFSTSSSSIIVPSSVQPTDKGATLPTSAVVGIAAGAVIFLLVVIVVVLVIVYFICCNRDRGSASDPIPMTEKHRARTHQPETGQPTYENPNDAVQYKQAPTGDLYAQPDMKSNSGRRPPPQPTYQDPNTIQRQQGPTGDMYAMPDRKPAKPGPGELYADLDLSTNSPRSPQPLIPSEQQQQHQPVLYSDVQHLR